MSHGRHVALTDRTLLSKATEHDVGYCPHCGGSIAAGNNLWSIAPDVYGCCTRECARSCRREMDDDETRSARADHWP